MRTLLSVALLCSAAVAQATLTTTFAGVNVMDGNMFDLAATHPQGITVKYLECNLSTGTHDLEIWTMIGGGSYVGSENNAAAWKLCGSAAGIAGAGPGIPTLLPICVDKFIPNGAQRGFYVTASSGGLRHVHDNTIARGSVYASNADLEFQAGIALFYQFGLVIGSGPDTRIWNGNIHYEVGDTSAISCGLSHAETFGAGCGAVVPGEAQYEQFAGASLFDLSNTGHTYTWTGQGYTLTDGAGPLVPTTAASTPFDDDETMPIPLGFAMPSPSGVVTDIALCSNGWLSFDASVTSTAQYEADYALRDAAYSRLAFLWDDLNPGPPPNGAGSVTIEQVSATETRITFAGVPDSSSLYSANTVQVALHADGTIEVRYGSCSLQDGLVGISPGFGAVDLGGTDYSSLPASTSIATNVGPFSSDLELSCTAPHIGGVWELTTSQIDPISPIAVTFFGERAPFALPLQVIGIPAIGCMALIQNLAASPSAPNVGGTAVLSLNVPSNPTLVGRELAAQSVALKLVNPASLVTSNGALGVIGS